MSLLPAVSTTISAAESGPMGGPTGGPARGSAMGGGPTGGLHAETCRHSPVVKWLISRAFGEIAQLVEHTTENRCLRHGTRPRYHRCQGAFRAVWNVLGRPGCAHRWAYERAHDSGANPTSITWRSGFESRERS